MSFKDIGLRLGISDSRVEQLHDAAMRKLRNALRRDFESHRSLANEIGSCLLDSKLESEITGRRYSKHRGG